MGLLSEILAYKQFEREKEMADINAISTAVDRFVGLRRQAEIDELDRRNIESQIEAREPSAVDKLLEEGEAIDAAKEIADITGDTSILDRLRGAERTPGGLISSRIDEFVSPSIGQGLERTPSGDLTDVGKAQLETKKQAASQKEKAGELAERDFRRASAAVDTAFDQVVSFNEKQFEQFDLKPGDFLGLFDRLTPPQLNEFKAAASGAGKESAALIARQIIPGVRAANITRIFAKSSAEIGNTIEGNAANVAASMGNAFANALSQEIKVFDEEIGREVNIIEKTIDPKTGKRLSELGIQEQSRAINDIKRDFAEKLRQDYILKVYKRNPNLLQSGTVSKIQAIEGAGLNPDEWEVVE